LTSLFFVFAPLPPIAIRFGSYVRVHRFFLVTYDARGEKLPKIGCGSCGAVIIDQFFDLEKFQSDLSAKKGHGKLYKRSKMSNYIRFDENCWGKLFFCFFGAIIDLFPGESKSSGVSRPVG